MKTKFTALALITASALSLAPKPAAANDKGLAIVGGFLGGLIVASAINESQHHDEVRYVERVDGRNDRSDEGCWKEVSVQVWVPGIWIEERGYYGRNYRRYVAGHYECRNNRVWVSSNRHDRRHHNELEAGYRYGHNR